MKIIKTYSVPNTNLAKSENYDELRAFADLRGHSEIKIVEIEISVIEDGDKITISKCYGSIEDENGVSTGGEYRDVSGIWKNGLLYDENGNVIQSVNSDINDHYPYKNVRLDIAEEIGDVEILLRTDSETGKIIALNPDDGSILNIIENPAVWSDNSDLISDYDHPNGISWDSWDSAKNALVAHVIVTD